MVQPSTALLILLSVLVPGRARAEVFGGSDLVRGVVENATVRALLGPVETPLPLSIADFLLDHPDLAAYIVRRRGLAPYRIEMRGPRESWADDGYGTQGSIMLVERTDRMRVYYGAGIHRGRHMPPIRATAAVVMRLEEEQGPDCRPRMRSSFDVSLRLANPFLSGVARVLAPFARKKAVRIFVRAFLVADRVGRLMAEDPDGISRDIESFASLSAADRAKIMRMVAGLKALPGCAAGKKLPVK